MQNFEGQMRCIMGNVEVASWSSTNPNPHPPENLSNLKFSLKIVFKRPVLLFLAVHR